MLDAGRLCLRLHQHLHGPPHSLARGRMPRDGHDRCRVVGRPVEEWGDDAREDLRFLQIGDFVKWTPAPPNPASAPAPARIAPLYQVMRQSDGKTLNIGVVQPSEGDPGGYADAAAQDAFCANTYCWITTLYDQSGKGNNLFQAPRGGFSGPGMGGFNNIPIADMAPITIMGHKVYGFSSSRHGPSQDDAKGTAVDDQAEGQYWVINGHHYNNGCCYDYGNAETDSRDDGDGTMETDLLWQCQLLVSWTGCRTLGHDRSGEQPCWLC